MQDAKKDGPKLAYATVDPAFASAPGLCEQFCEAGTGSTPSAKKDTRSKTSSDTPAYKAAPDYFDPQG